MSGPMANPPRPKKLLRLVALLIGVPVLVIALYYGKWELLDHRLVTITPGKVYQSAAIPADTLVETMQRLGIRTSIDLRDTEKDLVAAESAALGKAGLTYVNVPMSVNPRPEDAQRFFAALAKAERPVLVHCQHGEGRSVLMCALYRIEEEGWTNEAAFDATTRLPAGLQFVHTLIPPLFRFGADSSKGSMVLNYKKGDATSR